MRQDTKSYMKPYVNTIANLYNLPKVAAAILTEILASMVTSDNSIRLDSASRIEIMQRLSITNAQISTALKQMSDCNLIQKVSLSKRASKYTLNASIFGTSWIDIRRLTLCVEHTLDNHTKDAMVSIQATMLYYNGKNETLLISQDSMQDLEKK